jgi:hypothetical protein
MNDARATQVRFLKYLLPVIALSMVFNIPKFFEAEMKEAKTTTKNITDFANNLTEYSNESAKGSANLTDAFGSYDEGSSIDITALRKNPGLNVIKLASFVAEDEGQISGWKTTLLTSVCFVRTSVFLASWYYAEA